MAWRAAARHWRMMRQTKLGRTGINVSALCLGTMTFGDQTPQSDAFQQMDLALDHGVTFFDTAEMYASPPKAETQGETERIIGRWFAQGGKRARVVLASKLAGRTNEATWLRPDDLLESGRVRVTPKQIDYALTNSLKRLQTDYIDLYQVHWPDRGYAGFGYQVYRDYRDDYARFEDVLGALGRFVDRGMIRAIGVSNESPWGVMRYLHEAETRGLPRIASIQNAYSLVNRRFETGGLAEIALREDVGLLAYSPLAQGNLTGKYLGGAVPPGSRKSLSNRMWRYEAPGGPEMIEKYVRLASELGVSPVCLALNFVASRPWVTSTIIGASGVSQLNDDIAAFDLPWSDEMEKAVNALHTAHPDPCP